ncbi:TIGR04255 family protein [Nitrosococcus watsonii]|uniref:TIGR04255 family protein n=1 Tax=Nitrosococcus watsoni (strain C-113) TaxID=105559 RepID=D8K9P0_NITWC|nr:TIGR04255 family protein [Nitrosococcus watsonii]ADJ27329.1 conserved hypothetical protein [Nitrosococcus watsonii C-113]
MDGYKKLENQPLKFVLAEFRFSPVMQIAEYIPKIQEALRKQYPIEKTQSEQTVQVQPGGIAVSTVNRWAFISADKKSAIEINQERLVYITAEYPRFDGFSAACKQAIETLVDIVEPSLILRIGLRYSDLITIDDGEEITELVNEHFGLPSCIESLGVARQHSTDTFLRTDMGGLAIRTLYGKHNLSCLPDVQGLPISISADATPSERIILDFDHYWEAKDEAASFKTNDVIERLATLHETSREAFWKVTTDYARNQKWA